ncbi:MAG: NAD(P)/FAD-dependent oxidoreductase [Hespellia sp.]|nr:NAD(P)/FAD-dependent oxidoreductase [Hespellia sp.]
MKRILIVGGGAAGMMAAVIAGRHGHRVDLYERNEKLGKKLFITGKGRCNLTNACDLDGLFASVQRNARFLYSSFYGFTNEETIAFFEGLGLKTKIERGNRVFPASDRSSDVIRILEKELARVDVHIHLHTRIQKIHVDDGRFSWIETEAGDRIEGDACVIATGGRSYPSTGSTGDGYRFAESVGHRVEEQFPALVPMEVQEWYAKELQGLSLRNVNVTLFQGRKKVYEEFGEMLFTHYGVSGPIILSASSVVGRRLSKAVLRMCIDLKPALSEEQLDLRVLRELEENHKKQFQNVIDSLFPSKLKPVMLELSGINPQKRAYEITKEERKRFVHLIKHFEMTLTGLRDYREAVITSGGVNVKDVDPGTMESKLMTGIYFAGEVLDLDALTGGFNLQIAWSTAHAAGEAVGRL